tara:strand:+ start:3749 stop:4135 length:387 start_codon:yes stop_codon:yes gene_type:complete
MSEKFTVEIITPDKTILTSEAIEATIPAYEGQLGILKDHIPLITFLRPGFVIIKNDEEKKFYIEEGTVEFSGNNLLILTTTVRDLNNFKKGEVENLIQEAEKKLKDKESSDKEKFIISYKIDALKEIN